MGTSRRTSLSGPDAGARRACRRSPRTSSSRAALLGRQVPFSLPNLLRVRHRGGLVVDDRVERAALEDAVALAAAAGDGVPRGTDDHRRAAVRADRQALAHLVG